MKVTYKGCVHRTENLNEQLKELMKKEIQLAESKLKVLKVEIKEDDKKVKKEIKNLSE